LPDELVEYAGVVVIPMLLLGALGAVIVTGLGAALPDRSRLVRIGFVVLAVLLAASAAWLVLYAAGPDSYYAAGYSRWEHAERFMGTTPVVIAVVAAVITSAWLLTIAFADRRASLRLLAPPAAAISCLLLVFGWFALTAGH
jgi:hypothetical protein